MKIDIENQHKMGYNILIYKIHNDGIIEVGIFGQGYKQLFHKKYNLDNWPNEWFILRDDIKAFNKQISNYPFGIHEALESEEIANLVLMRLSIEDFFKKREERDKCKKSTILRLATCGGRVMKSFLKNFKG